MTDLPEPLLSALAYANGEPACKGVYRSQAEDFEVEEEIAFTLSGEGEHLWCWVEKRGENTAWVSQQLAKWAGVRPSAVGVAGQKDRHAVTRQWFSIQLPGQPDPDPETLGLENVRILKRVRHQRKLQTGGLSGNRFELTVRNIEGDPEALERRLEAVRKSGVPNYFGEQRFGFRGGNLQKAEAFFQGKLTRLKRNQKSLYISAARSWLFNLILSERVGQGVWNVFQPGDVLQLEGSNRWFLEDGSADLAERVEQGDLHPTGPLAGKGGMPCEGEVRSLEERVLKPYSEWVEALSRLGLKQDRRALRVLPKDFQWAWQQAREDDLPVLKLGFGLPAGSYATMVLRELLLAEDASAQAKQREKDT